MYRLVGRHPGAAKLMEFVPRLVPLERPGYWTTEKTPTVELFRPLLAGVFPGRWLAARLVTVKPGGVIPLHRDTPEEMDWRLVVVQTNPDAWVLHDGHWQRLEQDGIYESDQRLPHAAVNFGKEPRVHLVVGSLTC